MQITVPRVSSHKKMWEMWIFQNLQRGLKAEKPRCCLLQTLDWGWHLTLKAAFAQAGGMTRKKLHICSFAVLAGPQNLSSFSQHHLSSPNAPSPAAGAMVEVHAPPYSYTVFSLILYHICLVMYKKICKNYYVFVTICSTIFGMKCNVFSVYCQSSMKSKAPKRSILPQSLRLFDLLSVTQFIINVLTGVVVQFHCCIWCHIYSKGKKFKHSNIFFH